MGAARVLRAFVPRRIVNAILPLVTAAFIAWLHRHSPRRHRLHRKPDRPTADDR